MLKTSNLHYFVDDRGWSLFDMFASSNIPGQLNFSKLDKDIVKAFHLHRNQDDYVICLEGRVKLIVAKEDWTEVNPIILDERNPVVCRIPKNHWHGYKALDNGAKILYYCTKKFDGAEPDEIRTPWDVIGKEMWDIEFK